MPKIREEKSDDEIASARLAAIEDKAKIKKWSTVGGGLARVMQSFDEDDDAVAPRAVSCSVEEDSCDETESIVRTKNTTGMCRRSSSFSDSEAKLKIKKWGTVGGGLSRVFRDFDEDDEEAPPQALMPHFQTSAHKGSRAEIDSDAKVKIKKLCTVGKGLARVMRSFDDDDEGMAPVSMLPRAKESNVSTADAASTIVICSTSDGFSDSEAKLKIKKWRSIGGGLAHVLRSFDEDDETAPLQSSVPQIKACAGAKTKSSNDAKTQIKKLCTVGRGLARVMRTFDGDDEAVAPKALAMRAKSCIMDEDSGNETESTDDAGSTVGGCSTHESCSDSEAKAETNPAVARRTKACKFGAKTCASDDSGEETESTTDTESACRAPSSDDSSSDSETESDRRNPRKWNEVSGSLAWILHNAAEEEDRAAYAQKIKA